MKALTICQPYAHLICLPDNDDRAKRVENRTWATNYRGRLLIHAGKSRLWLGDCAEEYDLQIDDMTFGAIIGICNLAACVSVNVGPNNSLFNDPSAQRRWPWLTTHRHVEGPFCFVLTECRRLAKPIPFSGKQGIFNTPNVIDVRILNQLQPESCATSGVDSKCQ